MKRIRVPEGMLKAAIAGAGFEGYCADDQNSIREALEAALLWLSEHPQVPTDEQIQATCAAISEDWKVGEPFADTYRDLLVEWQRRCFVQEEPEIPAELHDLTWRNSQGPAGKVTLTFKEIDERIFEAYRRGLR